MLKKIYKLKNLEEFLGIFGLLYFLLLGVFGLFLTKFLVSQAVSPFSNPITTQEQLIRFQIDKASSLVGN